MLTMVADRAIYSAAVVEEVLADPALHLDEREGLCGRRGSGCASGRVQRLFASRDSAQLAVANAQGARDAADSVDPREGGGGLPKRLWEPRAPSLAIPPGGQLGLEPAEIGGIKFRCAHDAPQHADRRKFLHARLPKQQEISVGFEFALAL